MDFVRVYTEEDYHSFPSGLWGIPDPTPEWSGKKRQSGVLNLRSKNTPKLICFQVFDADCNDLDLILVPGSCDVPIRIISIEIRLYRRCI